MIIIIIIIIIIFDSNWRDKQNSEKNWTSLFRTGPFRT